MAKRTQIKSTAQTAFFSDMPIIPGSIFFLCVSSILVILSVVSPNLLSSARMGAVDTLSPVLSIIRSPFDTASNVIGDATGLAALKAENIRLNDENARLREWYQRALALQVENKALGSLLNVKLAPELKYTTARILSDTSSSYVKSLLISAGTAQGLAKSQPVLSGEGVLGQVVELGDNTARVLLLTDLNARIPVVVENSNVHAIVAGTNGKEAALTHLPEDTQFKEGHRLLTSGLGGVYPAGLPVGVVTKVSGENISVKPYADINRIHFVRIITNAENPNLQIN